MSETGLEVRIISRGAGVLDFFFATYVARNRQSPIGFLEWVDTNTTASDAQPFPGRRLGRTLIVDRSCTGDKDSIPALPAPARLHPPIMAGWWSYPSSP